MNDVMLDIETLDTRPSAVILSIGAIRFDIDKPGVFGATFHEFIDIDSSLTRGCTVSGSTLSWWLSQDEVARMRIVDADAKPLGHVLSELSDFINEKDRVWGNGASFDNVIVSNAYRSCDLPVPWRYWNEMCFRSLRNIHRDVPKPAFDGVRHDALDDAKNQAHHLQLIVQKLKAAA